MAKITFYPDPLDPSKKEEFKSSKSLKTILKERSVENKPFCVIVNDEIPDNVPLSKRFKKNDEIKIISFFEGGGGGGGGGKNFWETLYDIVTIAAVFVPVVGPYVSIGMGLARGFIFKNKGVDEPARIGTPAPAPPAPSQADNRARHHSPIPIVFGKVRFSPDLYSDFLIHESLQIPEQGSSGNVLQKKMLRKERSYSSQAFCFGFGDLEISNRMIGLMRVDGNITDSGVENGAYWGFAGNFGFQRQNDFRDFSAGIPSKYGTLDGIRTSSIFDPIPLRIYKKKSNRTSLGNVDDTTSIVALNDHLPRNWSIFQGALFQNKFEFKIEGHLFDASGSNTVDLEIQWKYNSDANWSKISSFIDIYRLTNDTQSYVYSLQDVPAFPTVNQSLMVRVRQKTRDPLSTDTGKVSRLTITEPTFYCSDLYQEAYNSRLGMTYFPMHIEGCWLSNNLLADDSSINTYSAIVESKCYRFNFSNQTWQWGKTSNPAWWFLFFAKGGFFALESRIADPENVFPYSPTNFWQNHVGHSKNTEIIFGAGLELDRIDIEKIKEWAIFCDENGLECNFVHYEEETVHETLERIANLGRASVFYNQGKLSVVVEDKNQTPVTMFGNANIIANSFKVSYQSRSDVFAVEVEFFNKDLNYDSETIRVEVPFFFGDQKKIVSKTTLRGVTSKSLAQREANLLAGRQFFQKRTYSWSSDHEGLLANRGDLVYLSHDSTQFGYSGRVVQFIVDDNNNFLGIKGSGTIDHDCDWLMIRLPNGEMKKYQCHIIDGDIFFNDEFLKQDGPYHIRNQKRNAINNESRFPNTTADDFIYIADIKETTGKIVRISSVETDENHNFTYTAVDEDPALWAFEYGSIIDPRSYDDAIGIIEVFDCSLEYLENDKIKLYINASDDCLFMIIDLVTNLPIDINGRFSFSGKEVIIESEREVSKTYRIVPLSIHEKVQSRTLEFTVWPNL